jgi:phosphopantetheine adenylyltransferase
VSGYRVTIKDFEYGEVCSYTGSNVSDLMLTCISKYDDNVKKLKAEKVEKLSRRKKEIQRELEEVSNELTNIMLEAFETKRE